MKLINKRRRINYFKSKINYKKISKNQDDFMHCEPRCIIYNFVHLQCKSEQDSKENKHSKVKKKSQSQVVIDQKNNISMKKMINE